MKIAIASGKGGVGKTTLAVVLAAAAAREGVRTAYVDCDVEAPNGHLLLQPTLEQTDTVTRSVPTVDPRKCARCGACQQACQFGAIVLLGKTVKVYPHLCKSCGACKTACPQDAISGRIQPIGRVEIGHAGPLRFIHGVMDVGQARCIPVIEAAKSAVDPEDELIILDAPPGTACPMVATVRDADRVVLVTEATPFGLADLKLAVETARVLDQTPAVIINRSDRGDDRVRRFCDEQGLALLAEIPYSQVLARAYAEGQLDRIAAALDDLPMQILAQWADAAKRRAS